MTTKVIKVSGMTCGHCVSAVTEELSSIAGVSSVAVELVPGEVSVVTVPRSTRQGTTSWSDAAEHHIAIGVTAQHDRQGGDL